LLVHLLVHFSPEEEDSTILWNAGFFQPTHMVT
jgi:hypothetical protein